MDKKKEKRYWLHLSAMIFITTLTVTEPINNPKIKTFFNTSVILLLFLLLDSYKQKKEKYNEELIHKVRVELKKIRFCLVLLSDYNSNQLEFSTLYKPFKKIFKIAGKTRDEQVRRELEKKYSGKKKILADNKKKLHESEQKFFSQVEKYAIKVKVAAASEFDLINNLSPIPINELCAYLIAELRYGINEETSDENLHPSRNILKAMAYSAELAPEIKERLLEKIDIDKCDELETTIGKWHDLGLLKKWIDKKKKRREFSIKKIRKAIRKRKKEIKTLIPEIWKQ